MFTYLCKFLYVGDTSSHSASIPDQVGHMILIKSDSAELESIPIYDSPAKLKLRGFH